MVQLASKSVISEHENLDADYMFLASGDSSSDDESQNDENDAFNVSCHGNHFKRMKEEPKQCGEFTIKRRKLHTQLDMMNSVLRSMSFGENENVASSDEPSFGSVSSGKRTVAARKITKKRLARKAKN